MQPGFLYDLTDADAGEGEFRYLTQGALAVGDLVLAFTLLTSDRPSTDRVDCLKLLRTARQVGVFNSVGAPRSHAAIGSDYSMAREPPGRALPSQRRGPPKGEDR